MITRAFDDADPVTHAAPAGAVPGRWDSFGKNLRKYFKVLLWLLKSSIWESKLRALLVLALGVAGVSCQVSAFGLAIYYGHLLERGQKFALLTWTLDPRSSVSLLAMFAFGVMLAFLLSALLVYASELLTLDMVARNERRNVERALQLFNRHPTAWPMAEEATYTESGLMRLISGDARMIGRVLRLLLKLIVPMCSLLVAIVLLLITETMLTLLVLALVATASVFLYRISKRGVACTRTLEESTPGAQRDKKAVLEWGKGMYVPELGEHNRIAEVVDQGKIAENRKAFIGRLATLEHCRLANNVVFAIGLFAIIVVLGGASIRQQAGWGLLVIYLAALRYAMNYLRTTTGLVTSISRFYPLFGRYFHFVEFSENPPQPTGLYGPVHAIRLQESVIPETQSTLLVRPGSRLALLTHVSLSRYTLAEIFEQIGVNDRREWTRALGSVSFARRQIGCPPASLRELVRYGPDETWNQLIGELSEAGLGDGASEQLVRNLDRRLDDKLWERVDVEIRFALAMLAIVRSQTSWVLLEQQGFDAMPPAAREYFLNRLADRVVIVVCDRNWDLASSHVTDVAVVDENGPVGLGTLDWARERVDVIQREMAQRASEGYQTSGEAAEVDDTEMVDLDVM